MIERVKDFKAVKAFLARPEMLESIGWNWNAATVERVVDEWADKDAWIVKAEEGPVKGLMVFIPQGNGSYEAHACCDRASRGWAWVRLSRQVLKWFFTRSGAEWLWTSVRAENAISHAYVRRMGFVKNGAYRTGEVAMHSFELEKGSV